MMVPGGAIGQCQYQLSKDIKPVQVVISAAQEAAGSHSHRTGEHFTYTACAEHSTCPALHST